MTEQSTISAQARDMAARVERFVRDEIVPYERTRAATTTARRPTSWSMKCAQRPARRAC